MPHKLSLEVFLLGAKGVEVLLSSLPPVGGQMLVPLGSCASSNSCCSREAAACKPCMQLGEINAWIMIRVQAQYEADYHSWATAVNRKPHALLASETHKLAWIRVRKSVKERCKCWQ